MENLTDTHYFLVESVCCEIMMKYIEGLKSGIPNKETIENAGKLI